MSDKTPRVSVVVSTKNEERVIARCLESIRLQTYPNIELIVVDNYSTDRTQDIARDYTPHVFARGPERSAQRNFGLLQQATGEIGAYIDADMILGPSVIDQSVSLLQSGCIGVYVPEIVIGRSHWIPARNFERSFYDGTPVDAARVFKLDAFRAVSGFDEEIFSSGSGEDWDLDIVLEAVGPLCTLRRQGHVTDVWPLKEYITTLGAPSLFPNAIFHDEDDFVLREFLRKKRYYATGFDRYRRKHGASHPRLRYQFSVWNRSLGIFVRPRNLGRSLAHPVLSIQALVMRFLVGVSTRRGLTEA
jgi:glycosyltransferase involved in cell wall biosynthesis